MMDFSSRALRMLFPSAMYSTPNDTVHLTFDDGPHAAATPIVLDVLRQFNIQATFFLLGQHAQRWPQLVRIIAGDGHTVGNHSFDHLNLILRNKEFVRRQISTTNGAIYEATGILPNLFRPPFGYFDTRLLNIVRSYGMRLVHWTNDIRDFRTGTSEMTIARRVRQIDKGSIILMHDNDATANKVRTILPALIRMILDRGLVFGTLD